jgi:hypothetical protein
LAPQGADIVEVKGSAMSSDETTTLKRRRWYDTVFDVLSLVTLVVVALVCITVFGAYRALVVSVRGIFKWLKINGARLVDFLYHVVLYLLIALVLAYTYLFKVGKKLFVAIARFFRFTAPAVAARSIRATGVAISDRLVDAETEDEVLTRPRRQKTRLSQLAVRFDEIAILMANWITRKTSSTTSNIVEVQAESRREHRFQQISTGVLNDLRSVTPRPVSNPAFEKEAGMILFGQMSKLSDRSRALVEDAVTELVIPDMASTLHRLDSLERQHVVIVQGRLADAADKESASERTAAVHEVISRYLNVPQHAFESARQARSAQFSQEYAIGTLVSSTMATVNRHWRDDALMAQTLLLAAILLVKHRLKP